MRVPTSRPKVKGKVKAKRKPKVNQAAREKALQRREEAELAGLINNAATERYSGQERVLAEETRRTSGQGATIDQAYATYQSQVAQLAAQQQQQMAQAAQAQAQVAIGVAGAQTALGAEQAAATQATAQRYGLDGGAHAAEASKLSGQLGAVQGARAQAQAGTTAAIGLAQGERLTAASLSGIGGHKRDRERNAQELKLLSEKGLNLETDKGAFKGTLRQQIKQQADEQRLAEAALGIKETDSRRRERLALLGLEQRATEERNDVANDNTDNRRDAAKLDQKIESDARKARQKDKELSIREAEAAKKPGAKPKLSPAKRNEWNQKKHRILELRNAFRSGIARGKTTAQISAELKGYSRVELNMARDLALRTRLGAENRVAAESYFPGGMIPGGFIAPVK